jgi:multidrug efflux pump subunit AcrA (membrane-fusion protein)
VDVPLADAAKIGVGQQAEVVVDVLPERTFKGRLTRIVNEADVQKNTLQVKVAIEEPATEIKPEMLARARFLANPDARADGQAERLLVPESVLLRHAGGHTMLWIADQARNQAVARTVTLGTGGADGWVVVEAGVQAGDRVIVDPPENLKEGAHFDRGGRGDAALKGADHGTH